MAKSKRKNIKKKTNKSNKINWTDVIHNLRFFFRNEQVQFILGLLITFAGLFIILTIVSFFFTGALDNAIVNNISYKEYHSLKASDTPKPEIHNWMGVSGAYLSHKIVNNWFGIVSLLIPIFLVLTGLRIMKISKLKTSKVFFITAYGLIAGSITEAFIFGNIFTMSHINWGGTHGSQISELLKTSIGIPGMILLIILFIITAFIILKKSSMQKIQETMIKSKPSFGYPFGKSQDEEPDELELEIEIDNDDSTIEEHRKGFFKRVVSFFSFFKRKKQNTNEVETGDENDFDSMDSQETDNTMSYQEQPMPATSTSSYQEIIDNTSETIENDFEIIVPKDDEIPEESAENERKHNIETKVEDSVDMDQMEDYDPKKDLSTFTFPTMELLKVYNTGNKAIDMQEQNDNKNRIITTLRNYGIEITSIKATVGPTITLYEIIPQAGVRISKIRNLEDDIALSLSALGIRIIAPMPGKGTIGIEVPNKDPQIVSMQSVIASKRFQECDYDLPVALGKTITNEVFIFDLAKMPHLLVAGATGQGKSVGLNAIITSLLYKKHPSELKMVLIDPKMVEFNIYSTIEKHYLAKLPDHEKAIITDVTKVTQTLNSLTKEMDDRYELLMRAKVRTIKEYNEKFVKRRLNPNNGHRYLPYIVVVIDEFGDLIMTAGKEIEMPIARIAQKARAVGMHMVIATQRPTTNIITGTIKANFPARMAFRVTSQIDSRTILDATGANQLIGRGDMLFSQGSHLIRIQCAFVDTPEVEDITQYIGNQRGYESAFVLPEVLSSDIDDKTGGADISERDVLFEEAARLIVIHQQGSTSLIQRKFSVGYNRAGRLMDQLEATGVVGPAQGSKPRDVYVQDEYTLEKLLDSLR